VADNSRFRHRPIAGAVRPDLTGSYGIGRRRDWDPVSVERQLAERIGAFTNYTLRRAAPLLRDKFIRERLSAAFPTHRRGRAGGVKWIKLPLSAGLRRKSGDLQRSVRMTVTSPGTTATRFRGVFNLSSKVGGGKVQYAHRHENEGRMQFGRVTATAYEGLVRVIDSGVRMICTSMGVKVSFS
jgi:hypothetical protein